MLKYGLVNVKIENTMYVALQIVSLLFVDDMEACDCFGKSDEFNLCAVTAPLLFASTE